jgi:hypothetical protein
MRRRHKRIVSVLIALFLIGGLSACKEERSDGEIIHDAIEGKIKEAYWLLMSSSVVPSGYEKVILVSGFWDNYPVCEELKVWGKSNPLRAGRTFRCEKVPSR